MPVIPKKIHAVWLGSVLGKDGRENIANWRAHNPKHEINLWIDSSTFPTKPSPTETNNPEYTKKLDEYNNAMKDYQDLLSWAKENKVKIRDINGKDKKIYNNMLSQGYYNDEISGKNRNLAAASDILRTEVLYREGGIYFDVKDVFPGKEPIRDFKPKYGFCCNMAKDSKGDYKGSMNNDLLASVPKGTIISAYRQAIHNNYNELYKNDSKVRAHRDAHYRSIDSANPRQDSTLNTSGPRALITLLHELDGKPIPEANGENFEFNYDDNIAFPSNFYALPQGEATDQSWLDKSDYKQVMRNYLNEFLSKKINDYIQSIGPNQNENMIRILNELQKVINSSFPPLSENMVPRWTLN